MGRTKPGQFTRKNVYQRTPAPNALELLTYAPVQRRNYSAASRATAAHSAAPAPDTRTSLVYMAKRERATLEAELDADLAAAAPAKRAVPAGVLAVMPAGKIRKPKKRCCRAWFDYATGLTHINKRCDARAKKGVPYAPASRPLSDYQKFIQANSANRPRGPGSGPAGRAWMQSMAAAWSARKAEFPALAKNKVKGYMRF
jgi:hypothetical protein